MAYRLWLTHTAQQVDLTWSRFGVKCTVGMFFSSKKVMFMFIFQSCHLIDAGKCRRHAPAGPPKLEQLT